MNVWRSASHKALIGILAVSAAAFGQSGGQQPLSDGGLSEKVTNPIALLTRVTVENKYSPSMWDIRDSENQVEGQQVLPFKAFARQNLTRVKIFFQTSSSDGTHGLSECEIFDLLIYERGSGDLGVGLSAHLTAESSNQLGTVAPGPAVGAVFKHKTWRYGIFNENFLSDTFAQTELQPILSDAVNDKWSAEIGDAQYTYDWKKHHVTLSPLSGQLNRIVSFESQKIHLFFQGQYNLKNESGSDKWTLTAAVSLIVNP